MSVATETNRWLEAYARRPVPAAEPAWLTGLRRAGMDDFARQGFPSTRLEEWRFTNVAAIARTDFAEAPRLTPDSATAKEVGARVAGLPPATRLVFVNGVLVPELSHSGVLAEGVQATSLARALRERPRAVSAHLGRVASGKDHPFVALNTALASDGAYIHCASHARMHEPLQLVFVATASEGPTACHPRVLVVAEPGAEVRLVEVYLSLPGETLTNAVSEVVVGEGAHVEHVKLQSEALDSFHMATLHARQERSSTFTSYVLSFGAALARHDVNAVLAGEGVETTLNGLFVVQGRQHVDCHTRLDHLQPHGVSRETYKGILSGAATGVFNGRIHVALDAQKTDARQTNKNLLLSDEALVQTNPQLEINADDVKCSHGSTVGQIDPDQLFYLRARGLDRKQARDLLVYAFAEDVVEKLNVPGLGLVIEEALLRSLGEGAVPAEASS